MTTPPVIRKTMVIRMLPKSLIRSLSKKLGVCRDMFHGFDYTKFTTGTDLERAKTISGAVNYIIAREKEKEKDTFIKEALMLHQALLFVLPWCVKLIALKLRSLNRCVSWCCD